MSKSTTTVSPATADMVRAFYRDPKAGAARIARFNLTEDKSIREGARGRLSPASIAGYNKGKPEGRRYVSGATKAAVSAQKDTAKAAREAARKAGLPVGNRGPLSAKAQAAAGVTKPKSRSRKG